MFETDIAEWKAILTGYKQSCFYSTVLTPQHYHWYAAIRFAFPGGWLAKNTTAGNELNRVQ